MRLEWGDELEAAARHPDYRVRGVAFRALAQFRYRQKLELLRRGLDDESPAVRGSALIVLESFSRDHPGDVNQFRPLLKRAGGARSEPRGAAARHRVLQERHARPCDDPHPGRPIAGDDEAPAEVRKAAAGVSTLLVKKQRLTKK